MFRRDADLQKLAESRTQVDLDTIADDAFSLTDEDETKYEAFEAGFDLGKSAGAKDIWEVVISPEEKSLKTSYFFIGTKEEIKARLEKVPIAAVEKVEDSEIAELREMEGA